VTGSCFGDARRAGPVVIVENLSAGTLAKLWLRFTLRASIFV
jgi:hypothetical protein